MTAFADDPDTDETGSLSVLNAGAGDIQISFNEHNEDEARRAIAMLQDMQRRGYAILIRLPDNSYVRATDIDAERGRYIIQVPPEVAASVPYAEPVAFGHRAVTAPEPEPSAPPRGRRKAKQKKGKRGTVKVGIPVKRARATSVGASAGG